MAKLGQEGTILVLETHAYSSWQAQIFSIRGDKADLTWEKIADVMKPQIWLMQS
jgi:hypothetical protein